MMWLLVALGLALCYPFFKWVVYTLVAVTVLTSLVVVDMVEAFGSAISNMRR